MDGLPGASLRMGNVKGKAVSGVCAGAAAAAPVEDEQGGIGDLKQQIKRWLAGVSA